MRRFGSLAAALALVLQLVPAIEAGTITGKVTATGLRNNANAVVYIEKIEGKTFTPPEEPVVMDQKGKEFRPMVLPVLVGTTVDFLNSDPFNHNVFSPDKCAGKFNLGTWSTGDTRAFTFTEPCAVVVLCNVHPEMVGYVVAVETPYFAVTNDEGNYTIKGVPDGEYGISVWHERLKKQTQTVKVNGEATADFTLKR